QATSWRICSVVVPVGASCGVPAAGTADTGPVAAAAGLSPAAPTASTAATVPAPFHASRPDFGIMPTHVSPRPAGDSHVAPAERRWLLRSHDLRRRNKEY